MTILEQNPQFTPKQDLAQYLAAYCNEQFESVCLVCSSLLHQALGFKSAGKLHRGYEFSTLRSSSARCALCRLTLLASLTQVGKGHYQFSDNLRVERNLGFERCVWTISALGRLEVEFRVLKFDRRSPCVASRILGSSLTWRTVLPFPNRQSSLVKGWLKSCRTHPHCRGEITGSLPTRLVDLGPDCDPYSQPLLVSGKALSVEYVALSYRWGRQDFIKLSLDRLPQFMNSGFRSSDLSPLFSDVITVLRALKIRYLWIDALCIIQPGSDQGKDWAIECAKMRDVYARSLFTISATACMSPLDSLFVLDPSRYIRVRPTDGHEHEELGDFLVGAFLKIGPSEHPQNWSELLTKSPISSRAWTLQERFLPPAVLHFDGDHVFWECRTGILDKRYEWNSDVNADLKHILPSFPHTVDRYLLWYQFVENYQSRLVKDSGDRLPAIGGLAAHFSEQMQDEYIAGLWKNDMLRGLLWMRAAISDQPAAQVVQTNKKAPSWSWAHLNTPVIYIQTSGDRYYNAILPIQKVEEHARVTPGARRAPQGPFGDIEEAQLRVEGCLLEALRENGCIQGWNSGTTWHFDEPFPCPSQIWLLLMGIWYLENRQYCAYFLALQRVSDDEASAFNRIGLGRMECGHALARTKTDDQNAREKVDEAFEGGEWTTITLV